MAVAGSIMTTESALSLRSLASDASIPTAASRSSQESILILSAPTSKVRDIARLREEVAIASRAQSTRPEEEKFKSWAGNLVWGLPFPLAILGLWSLASHDHWVPEQILPAPSLVWKALAELGTSGEVSSHLLISFTRLFWGFVGGASLGFLLGIVFGLSAFARDYLLPSFKVFAQIPVLGWLPLLMILVGIDEPLKIILILKAVCVPVALNTCNGLQSIPNIWVEVARVYRFNRWQLLRKMILPAAFPQIWTGLRYGLTKGWLALVVVELLASSEGLGFLIVYGRQLFQLDLVLAAVAVVGLIGWSLDKILSVMETRILRWRRPSV